MYTRLVNFLAICLAVFFIGLYLYPFIKPAPAGPSVPAAGAITVTDFSGQTVSLDKPAEKIACLLESGLAGLYMLGAQDKVIAVNNYLYQPHIYPYYQAIDPRFAAKSLPDVGEGEMASLEKITALKPDLVIVWAGYPAIIKNLKDRGINVFAVQLNSFGDIFKEMELLGKLTGKETRAAELIAAGREELANIRRKVGNLPAEQQPTCYFSWAESKLDAAGGASTGTQLIMLAGGKSVTADNKQEHLKLNVEQVIKWNPAVIISWYGPTVSPDKFLQDSQWQNIAAVKSKRVYQLPDAFSCDLWTLKYIYGVKAAAGYLHPELWPVDLQLEKMRLFQILYGPAGEKLANVSI
ncbi:MAG TPA: ABC transporter substrate-binding protein [Methylomusa anaerophila]|uniref:Vitamin B12-binding protein n=1 Tax=Methylomusa anaerophila TaxID=1930071 RepID=A0A348AEG5_9FIRM|nr:ABC transporter substrate-binding protein [Methylomusa anaerophila]BBB89463.1 vitamin B12-binding protein precursor [Methylomusa anaerophila]HML89695.1 ABC transporter substrate-binding protein [Methylomusa anaerophila]